MDDIQIFAVDQLAIVGIRFRLSAAPFAHQRLGSFAAIRIHVAHGDDVSVLGKVLAASVGPGQAGGTLVPAAARPDHADSGSIIGALESKGAVGAPCPDRTARQERSVA